MGDPKSCIVAFKAKTFHIYSLADEMKDRGWLLQTLQFPSWYGIITFYSNLTLYTNY